MPVRKITLPTPNTVAASSTSLISLPLGTNYRYRAVHLEIGCLAGTNALAAGTLPAGSSTLAYVNDIRVKANGRVQRLHTARELVRLNRLCGSSYAESIWGNRAGDDYYGQTLTIWFAEPWRKSLAQQEALALPSWMLNSLEIEVDFAAAPTNAASSAPLLLNAWAEVDSNPADDIHKTGVVMAKVFRHNITGGTAAGSAVDVTWLDRRDLYTTIVADTGNTSAPGTAANGVVVAANARNSAKLKITANGTEIADVPKHVAAGIHANQGLNPGQFDLECILDSADDIRSGLTANGLSDLRVRLDIASDTANSANWVLLTERTGTID